MLSRISRPIFTVLITTSILAAPILSFADNWPRYRGENGDGHYAKNDLPVKWSAKNIQWKTPIRGTGQSSPVIWGDNIFITSATDKGMTRWVICIDRKSGKVKWETPIKSSQAVSLHRMNTWATSTCATDGKNVIAFFGEAGIHCLDMTGKKVWSRQLGDFPGAWGTAASPVILGNQVIQNCDAQGKSYLISLNKKTGKPIWKTPRRNLPRGGWSTPILIDTGKRKELILNGEYGVQGYDPNSGKDLWYCKSFNGRGTPTPAWGGGLLYVVNGKPGDVYAVKPGGSGDVTKTNMAWHSARKGGRDLPSPILVGDHLFIVAMGGVSTCYHAPTGKPLWTERLGGKHSGSPIAANGLIYVPNEAGEVTIIKPGKTLNIVAKNALGNTDDQIFRSSPAAANGVIYHRSDRFLYAIGK